MSGQQTTVEIPRLDEESARAHDAKVRYVAMGPDRSLEKLRQQIGNRSVRYLEQWSTRFDWQATARAWDDQQAAAALAHAADAYRRDLEDHRKRYGDAGKALYQVAGAVLQQLGKALAQPPMVIEGKDGKVYRIPGIEPTPQMLTTAARAMTIAADLEAHALRLGDILPRLDQGDEHVL